MNPIAVGNPNGKLMRIGKPTSIVGTITIIPTLDAIMLNS